MKKNRLDHRKTYEAVIKIEQAGDCHLAQDHLNREGYARIRMNKKSILLHRFVYEMNYGEIPSGMLIRHLCNNPACVNPAHLAVGKDKDNAQDRENSLPKEFIERRTKNLHEAHKRWRARAA